MSESIDLVINPRLKDHYGIHTETNQPNFRVVWSSDQFEKRRGKFAVFDDTGVYFLREIEEVTEVPKYDPHNQDMWILERLLPTVGNPYLEGIVNFSYEPIWAFGAGNSDRTPIWKAVKLLVDNCLRGHDPNAPPKSPKDLEREEEQRMLKEKELFRTMLRDESPVVPSLVNAGSGVFLDHSNFDKKGSGDATS